VRVAFACRAARSCLLRLMPNTVGSRKLLPQKVALPRTILFCSFTRPSAQRTTADARTLAPRHLRDHQNDADVRERGRRGQEQMAALPTSSQCEGRTGCEKDEEDISRPCVASASNEINRSLEALVSATCRPRFRSKSCVEVRCHRADAVRVTDSSDLGHARESRLQLQAARATLYGVDPESRLDLDGFRRALACWRRRVLEALRASIGLPTAARARHHRRCRAPARARAPKGLSGHIDGMAEATLSLSLAEGLVECQSRPFA
jgi:hypothetical protein